MSTDRRPSAAIDEVDGIDPEAGARAALYGLCVDLFDEPGDELAGAIADGELHGAIETLRTRSGLAIEVPAFETDDDPETLRARYNALFEVGNPEPPVSPYESTYREEVSWNDVNLDLARAYDYFGLDVDRERREHHDHLRLLLEFAAFLARLEAVGEESGRRARATFLERHLRVLVDGLCEAIDEEPGTGVYGDAIALLDRLVAADRADMEGSE